MKNRFVKILCGAFIAIPCAFVMASCGDDGSSGGGQETQYYTITCDSSFANMNGLTAYISTNEILEENGVKKMQKDWTEYQRTITANITLDTGYLLSDNFSVTINDVPMQLDNVVTGGAGETNAEKLADWTTTRYISYTGVVSSDITIKIVGNTALATTTISFDFSTQIANDGNQETVNFDIIKVNKNGAEATLDKENPSLSAKYGEEIYLDYHADKDLDMTNYASLTSSNGSVNGEVLKNKDGSLFLKERDGKKYFRVRVVAESNYEKIVPVFYLLKQCELKGVMPADGSLYDISMTKANSDFSSYSSVATGTDVLLGVSLTANTSYLINDVCLQVTTSDGKSTVLTNGSFVFDKDYTTGQETIRDGKKVVNMFGKIFNYTVVDDFTVQVGKMVDGKFTAINEVKNHAFVVNESEAEEFANITGGYSLSVNDEVTDDVIFGFSNLSSVATTQTVEKTYAHTGYSYRLKFCSVDQISYNLTNFKVKLSGKTLSNVDLTKTYNVVHDEDYYVDFPQADLAEFSTESNLVISIDGVTESSADRTYTFVSSNKDLENVDIYKQTEDNAWEQVSIDVDETSAKCTQTLKSGEEVRYKLVPKTGYYFDQSSCIYAEKDDELRRLIIGSEGEIYVMLDSATSVNQIQVYLKSIPAEGRKVAIEAPVDYTFTTETASGEQVTTLTEDAFKEGGYTFSLYKDGVKVENKKIYWRYSTGISLMLSPNADNTYTISEELDSDVYLDVPTEQSKTFNIDLTNFEHVRIYYKLSSQGVDWTEITQQNSSIENINAGYDNLSLKFVYENGYELSKDVNVVYHYTNSEGDIEDLTLSFVSGEEVEVYIPVCDDASFTLTADKQLVTADFNWKLFFSNAKVFESDDGTNFTEVQTDSNNLAEISTGKYVRLYYTKIDGFDRLNLSDAKLTILCLKDAYGLSQSTTTTLNAQLDNTNGEIYVQFKLEASSFGNMYGTLVAGWSGELNKEKVTVDYSSFIRDGLETKYITDFARTNYYSSPVAYNDTTFTYSKNAMVRLSFELKEGYYFDCDSIVIVNKNGVENGSASVTITNEGRNIEFAVLLDENIESLELPAGAILRKTFTITKADYVEIEIWNDATQCYEALNETNNTVEYGKAIRYRTNNVVMAVDSTLFAYSTGHLLDDNGFIISENEYVVYNVTGDVLFH